MGPCAGAVFGGGEGVGAWGVDRACARGEGGREGVEERGERARAVREAATLAGQRHEGAWHSGLLLPSALEAAWAAGEGGLSCSMPIPLSLRGLWRHRKCLIMARGRRGWKEEDGAFSRERGAWQSV